MATKLSSLHFLKLESSQQTHGATRYVLKDHFNRPVFKVESDKTESKRCVELQVIPLPIQKGGQENPVVFRITTSSYSIPASYTSCTILSPSGEPMGRILNVKDMGLSTCYNITDSKHAMSLEVSSINVENPEFHIKRVQNGEMVARIKTEDKCTVLSMRPEIDEETKKRLVTLIIFQELIEKNEKYLTETIAHVG